jgi:hypothetical protein
MVDPFAVKDCTLVAISTGKNAQNLRELRDRLEAIPQSCIYYHFWGGMLRPGFDEPEYQNDFAAWAWRSLHDKSLAERLALVDPTQFKDLEDLRRELIEVVEDRLDESEFVPWAKAEQRFQFIRSQIAVFDTGSRLDHPGQLAGAVAHMSLGSIFYHFIDARRRTAKRMSDFHAWLLHFGEEYACVVQGLSAIDPYFTTLAELRDDLGKVFLQCHAREEVSA